MNACMATDKPLVSIIVPVYQAQAYLNQCVDSLLKQSYSDLEIILVDDGSNDNSPAICDRYSTQDTRVKVLHQENRGVSAARNAGVAHSRGEYVAFVDSDDWVTEDHIEHLLNIAHAHRADLAVCRCEVAASKQENETLCLTREKAVEALMYQKLFDTSPWSKLYRREIVTAVPFPDGMFFEDLAVVCRMFAMAETVVYSSRQTYYYRSTPDGTMSGKHLNRLLDEQKAAAMMYSFVSSRFPKLTNAADCRRFSAYCQMLLKLPKNGFEQERAQIWSVIRNSRKQVLHNAEARHKNRMAAAISYFGEKAMRMVWKIIT